MNRNYFMVHHLDAHAVTDSLDAANKRETYFSGERVKQFWDQDRIMGRYISKSLSLREPMAWDVYLVYRLTTLGIRNSHPYLSFGCTN